MKMREVCAQYNQYIRSNARGGYDKIKNPNNNLGTHFFNPPRWMALFEMIPTPWTDKVVYARMTNFVGNRIGVYGGIQALRIGEKYGVDNQTLDGLTGKIRGHPKSATYCCRSKGFKIGWSQYG